MWCKIFSLLEKILDPPPLLFQYRTFYYFITYYTNAGYFYCYWRSSESFKGMSPTANQLIFEYCLRLLFCTFGWSQLTDYRLFVASFLERWLDEWRQTVQDCMKETEWKGRHMTEDYIWLRIRLREDGDHTHRLKKRKKSNNNYKD